MAKKKPAAGAKPAPMKPAAKKPSAKKPAARKPAAKKAAAGKKPPTDWVAVLKSGAAGVAKWNRLTGPARAAIPLTGADLSGADLSGIHLRGGAGAVLSGCKLGGARLGGTWRKASFARADLTGATLAKGAFDATDFTGATLAGADLSGGNFSYGTFAGANLTGADATNANFIGTDFTGATLADVALMGAEFDKGTTWPAGFVPPGEMRWHGAGTDPRFVGKGKSAAARDINGLMARLHTVIDEKRMARTLDMLKKQRNQIFSEVEPAMVRGIVKSQRDIDTVYSCVLTEDGTYSCGTADMAQCRGLADEPCKHLLVLVIGLARAGQLAPATADKWLVAANSKGPRWNKTVQNHIADSFLKYKGAQAGEIDWRPTETVPEDFYAM
ncbi:pentapeptide repeat-containing protein [Gemmata sp. JC717]|uniref:Pentapeptide repeat-containing protein n=1 Tax=Gemmata algarum TaxID=2975278 RepID=A0ABU5ETD9_9BACT|nr:pentapeptide repeat-containing protein [Gemmata algarum]MDY3555401.1 pentapeptide repeat-containing protein [Gemmata algarum]MDY3558425.1 pentapeptide repeat-containing protein [Gemmata algarum]